MQAGFVVEKLNHIAWKCRDAQETRAFYEDLLGLPLAHVVRDDKVPSTGDPCDYVHLFFRLGDGSFVAFFDLGDGKAAEPDPSTPGWVTHLALELATEAELESAKRRLIDAGVAVVGVVDHNWLKSIYFHDPNGIRLELSVRVLGDSFMADCAAKAHATLAGWTASRRHDQECK